MSTNAPTPAPALSHPTTNEPRAARLFYPAAAVLLLIITIYGFRNFFFHGKAFHGGPLTPNIRTLLIVHGLAMLGWILVFILQPTLIALRKYKVHMMVGRCAAALALALVVLGFFVAVHAGRALPPEARLYGMSPAVFLYIPLTSIAAFGVMVGLAVAMRKTPAAHRSLMLVATLSAISAATGRIPWLIDPFMDTLWFKVFGVMHNSVLLGVVLLAIRSALIRRLDVWLTITVTASAGLYAVMLPVSRSALWESFAKSLIG